MTLHHWSHRDKQLLCVLSRFLKSANATDEASKFPRESERLLAIVFSRNGEHGAPVSLTYGGIRRTIYELHRHGHLSWKEVFIDTNLRDLDRWNNEIKELQDAAATLGQRIVKRRSEHPDWAKKIRDTKAAEASSSHRRQRPTDENRNDATTMSEDVVSSEDEVARYTSLLSRSPVDAGWDQYSYADRMEHRLAFRVWSPKSHSVNGAEGCFAGTWTAEPIPTLPRSSFDFRRGVYAQLRCLKEPTPFVSITTSFMWALRMMLRDEDSTLAIIDMKSLFGSNHNPSYVTPVNAALQTMPPFHASLRHLEDGENGVSASAPRRRWTCMSEWLVYGQIPGAAILQTANSAKLRSYLRSHPNIDSKLHISEIAACNLSKDANKILKDAQIAVTGVFGKAVGSFVAQFDLDYFHSFALAQHMKHHWVDKHRNQTPRRRRTIKSKAINLIFKGGVSDGWIAEQLVKRKISTNAIQPPIDKLFEAMAFNNIETMDIDDDDYDDNDGDNTALTGAGNSGGSDEDWTHVDLVDLTGEADDEEEDIDEIFTSR